MPSAMKEEDALNLKKLVRKVLRNNSMKNLFKSKKPRPPAQIVRDINRLLSYIASDFEDSSPRLHVKVCMFLNNILCVYFNFIIRRLLIAVGAIGCGH